MQGVQGAQRAQGVTSELREKTKEEMCLLCRDRKHSHPEARLFINQ